jgi:chromosome segregation ATPase
MSNASTAILSAVALAAIGATFHYWNHAQRAEVELAALALERDSMGAQFRAERQRTARYAQDIAALQGEVASLKSKHAPPSGTNTASAAPAAAFTEEARRKESVTEFVTANLRQIAASIDRFKLEYGRAPASLDELVGEDKFIKRLNSVAGENYSALPMTTAQPLVVTTPEGVKVTFNPSAPNPSRVISRAELLVRSPGNPIKLTPAAAKALEAYRAVNNGKLPANIEAIIPYFATPQEGADFVEFLEAQKAARGK